MQPSSVPINVVAANDVRSSRSRVVCLSNVHTSDYEELRREPVHPVLSTAKRRDLFNCLAQATGRDLLILSSPPKATTRRSARWLPEVATTFGGHRQLFCANLDAPKIRVPASWLFYAAHVLKHSRSGDLVVIDNYEFIYIVAALLLKVCRKVTFVLDYEDGKHLVDRGWPRVLSSIAEFLGRRIIRAAMVAHPALANRLPGGVLSEVVPGFVVPLQRPGGISRNGPKRFLYSGSLDRARGVDLMLEALALLPTSGWSLDVTGAGPLEAEWRRAAEDPRWEGRVRYHGRVTDEEARAITVACDIGLNCQRDSDPISSATFPSKIFSYLSAGLFVISSRASSVPEICGSACLYYDEEHPGSLAAVMTQAISSFQDLGKRCDVDAATNSYSVERTTARLRDLLCPILMNDAGRQAPA